MAEEKQLLLLQAQVVTPRNAAELDADIRAFFCKRYGTLRRVAWSPTLSEIYVYLETSAALADSASLPFAWAGNVRISPLEQVFDTPGISHGAEARFHYVVEMDPEDGWMPEISRWYDTEHMPGLAAVPGCIRATRFLNHGHGPLSLACYDLTHAEALGSPPWLAVRATAWSDVARPHFTNTKRTMFDIPQTR
jgi:hypothetical protein